MPKKSLVLNGFLGGINVDSDASDLPSEGRGKDQAVLIKNMLVDYGGKIRVGSKFTDDTSLASGSTSGSDDTLLIFNNYFYRRTGVYKVGSDIAWSGKYDMVGPNEIDLNGAQVTGGIGLGYTLGVAGGFPIFAGKDTLPAQGEYAKFGRLGSTSTQINRYMSCTIDGVTTNNVWNEGCTYFDDITVSSGNYNAKRTALDHQKAWFESHASLTVGGTGISYVVDLTTNGENYVKLQNGLDGYFYSAENQGQQQMVDADEWDGVYIGLYMEGGSGSGQDEITCNVTYLTTGDLLATIVIPANTRHDNGWVYSDTYVVPEGTASMTGVFKFDFDGPYAMDPARPIKIKGVISEKTSEAGLVFNTSNGALDLFENINSQALPFDISADNATRTYTGDVTSIEIRKTFNNETNVGGIFRWGTGNLDTGDIAGGLIGLAGRYSGKDIYIECNFQPGDDNPYGWDHVTIGLDSHRDDWATATHVTSNTYMKYWQFTPDELDEQDVWNKRGILHLPYGAPTHEGSLFDPGKVVSISIMLTLGAGRPWNESVCTLYSIVALEQDSLGWTDKKIRLWQTDTRNNMETLPVQYTNHINFNNFTAIQLTIPQPGTAGYTGNIYYTNLEHASSKSIDKTYFLLAHVDEVKGVRETGSTVWTPWASGHVDVQFNNPPIESTFGFESGYEDGTAYLAASFETATVVGRQVYIGNVTQNGVDFPSRILKSPPGKLYGFSDRSYIDLELGAGAIKVLESSGDRLFVFSEDNLTIVNVAQDYEFLESSIAGGGVSNHYQVAKINEGLAYVNSLGVHYFDGNSVENLSDNAIDSIGFSTDSRMIYEPNDKLIMVWPISSSSDVYCYSLKSNSWVSKMDDVLTNSTDVIASNSVIYEGDAYVYEKTNGGTWVIKKVIDRASGTNVPYLQTGKINCGDMAMEKKFKKAYVTIALSGDFTIAWDIDSGTHTGSTATTGTGIKEIAINEKGKQIQFTISSAGIVAATGAEISDIQIIYQDRKVV